jgi:hypothetical protein
MVFEPHVQLPGGQRSKGRKREGKGKGGARGGKDKRREGQEEGRTRGGKRERECRREKYKQTEKETLKRIDIGNKSFILGKLTKNLSEDLSQASL